jgi:hypothetical protein
MNFAPFSSIKVGKFVLFNNFSQKDEGKIGRNFELFFSVLSIEEKEKVLNPIIPLPQPFFVVFLPSSSPWKI